MNRNAVIAAVTVLACACTAQPPPRGVIPTGGPPVILHRGPGEPAATATPGQTVAPVKQPNAADVRFAEAMIAHHRAGLEMAALARGRTTSRPVLAAAERVGVAQEAEITWLTTWLGRLGRTPEHAAHSGGHAMAALRGADFDRAFLTAMIAHHEGALDLAGRVVEEGADPAIRALAADIDQGQGAEITRMRALLRGSRALSE